MNATSSNGATLQVNGNSILLMNCGKILFQRSIVGIDWLSMSMAADIAFGNEPFGLGWGADVRAFLRGLIK